MPEPILDSNDGCNRPCHPKAEEDGERGQGWGIPIAFASSP